MVLTYIISMNATLLFITAIICMTNETRQETIYVHALLKFKLDGDYAAWSQMAKNTFF